MTDDTQMYGMTKQAVQDLIDDSYTKMVGASMVAMGMLSDIQEVLQHSKDSSIDKEICIMTMPSTAYSQG